MTQFFGKYRGTVVENVDPRSRGRLRVQVPQVLGEEVLDWAEPCVPFAGAGVGLFALPPVGAGVWVEFEAGDLDYPIWSGCFWGDGEVPEGAGQHTTILKTKNAMVRVDDTPGSNSLTIEMGGMKVVFDNAGIAISNGQGSTIELSGNQIKFNDDALEIT